VSVLASSTTVVVEIGKHGQAGEIGHTILFPQGKLCPCGNRGCLEQYTSNKVIYNEFAALKKLGVGQLEYLDLLYPKKRSRCIGNREKKCRIAKCWYQ
jgi:hypothetical protein